VSRRIGRRWVKLAAAFLSPMFLAAGASRQLPGVSVLPAPFERFPKQDLVALLYPGSEAPPVLVAAAVWKEPGSPRLLAAFLQADGNCELAEVGVEQGRMAVTARYKEPYHWDDIHGFDLAPYRITSNRRAMGVRYQGMVQGGTRVVLVLYLRSGATFERIFERVVHYQAMDSDTWSLAQIQILPGKGEYSDLRVVDRGSNRTVTERWTWDSTAHVYREVRK
jgi:hypothetical protein